MKKIDIAMVLNTAAAFTYILEPFRNPYINALVCFIFLLNMVYLTYLIIGETSELEAELRELEAERREFEAELRELRSLNRRL